MSERRIDVTYFFRKQTIFHSIERVFDTVIGAMPPRVSYRRVKSPFARGIFGRIVNIMHAWFHRDSINHITGDVQYLALGLPRRRTVLTVHDLASVKLTSGWRRELLRFLWFELPLRRVAAVTAISEATKRDILALTSCPESRISVIPNPLPTQFTFSPAADISDLPRLLQIGTTDVKNIGNLVRALNGVHCQLTIIGRLSKMQVALLAENKINYTTESGLTDSQIVEAYRRADIVVFCSIMEGFGMPIIEANAIGRPVVTSDIEPMRTVARGAACLVNPYDVGSIRAGIERVIGDSAYREELVRLGRINADRYSPSHVAAQYLSVYEEVTHHLNDSCSADGR